MHQWIPRKCHSPNRTVVIDGIEQTKLIPGTLLVSASFAAINPWLKTVGPHFRDTCGRSDRLEGSIRGDNGIEDLVVPRMGDWFRQSAFSLIQGSAPEPPLRAMNRHIARGGVSSAVIAGAVSFQHRRELLTISPVPGFWPWISRLPR